MFFQLVEFKQVNVCSGKLIANEAVFREDYYY